MGIIKIKILFLLMFLSYVICLQKGDFIGCYENTARSKIDDKQQLDLTSCITYCENEFYRYAVTGKDNHCGCENHISGVEINNTFKCGDYCGSCIASDIYFTGIFVSGPPKNLHIENVTETSAHIFWSEPESYIDIISYLVKANILHTYSSYLPISPEWTFSNNTFQVPLITLQPATKYNITVQAVSSHGNGIEAFQVIETKIGEPDNPPPQPTILRRDGNKMFLQMTSVINNNGPISSYRIIVIDEDAKQGFQPNNIKNYNESIQDGSSYYITAEISPEDINKTFIVGDGKYYGKYYNAPLNSDIKYHVLLGIVSNYNDIVKVTYSNSSGTHNGIVVLDVIKDETGGESPELIIGLSIAVGFLSFMLIATAIGFLALKMYVLNRRLHFTNNQELRLQGPMIEIENNGYIPEDEMEPINHYANLRRKVRNIPKNLLKIDTTNSLGQGKFGNVNSGTFIENGVSTLVAVYTIYDHKLDCTGKLDMIRDLDLLIRSGKHENLLSLIGTNETQEIVHVILEHVTIDLKNLLLGSRDSLPGHFSNMSEIQAFQIGVDIAKGMAHLESLKIVHKKLCARSIMITTDFIPKVAGFGLTEFFNRNKVPDYTRWTATEIFQGQKPNMKSDVWAFACILWEICTLGGTPYGNISANNEIPERIKGGLRLPQMKYVSDDLYQIMLNCWQLDSSERPTFANLVQELQDLINDVNLHLSFNLHSNFQYEQFYPDMELVARTLY